MEELPGAVNELGDRSSCVNCLWRMAGWLSDGQLFLNTDGVAILTDDDACQAANRSTDLEAETAQSQSQLYV